MLLGEPNLTFQTATLEECSRFLLSLAKIPGASLGQKPLAVDHGDHPEPGRMLEMFNTQNIQPEWISALNNQHCYTMQIGWMSSLPRTFVHVCSHLRRDAGADAKSAPLLAVLLPLIPLHPIQISALGQNYKTLPGMIVKG